MQGNLRSDEKTGGSLVRRKEGGISFAGWLACFHTHTHTKDAAMYAIVAIAMATAAAHAPSLLAARRHAHAKQPHSHSRLCAIGSRSQCTAFGNARSGVCSRVRHRGRPLCGAALEERSSLFLHDLEFDVVVIGAGIIGLTLANRILEDTPFSVAVVDAKQPCSGATGAGELPVFCGIED